MEDAIFLHTDLLLEIYINAIFYGKIYTIYRPTNSYYEKIYFSIYISEQVISVVIKNIVVGTTLSQTL